MDTEETLSRGLNYLGELGSKLRDLRGTATLAHELIQNAEDAIKDIPHPSMQQATITFRIDHDALIVDNGGVFSDCGHQDQQVCPWTDDDRRPCDFHSFRDVGGAAKRRASAARGKSGGLKGAFGFGFTAVYQVTDHPQLITNGRHWILQDHMPENERIRQCKKPDCAYCKEPDLPGTRFVLRWAFEATSEVRKGLNAPIVLRDRPQQLVDELEVALPQTILFLDHLRRLQVFWNRTHRTEVSVTDRSEPVITVSTNNDSVDWVLLADDFADVAASLRLRHPEGEKCPSSEVKIAIPQGGMKDGLFFAYLPTQMETGAPFHINADFFPSNDRKRLLLETDYQGDWNRAAIRAGATALSKGLMSLRSHLGPSGFWNLVGSVRKAAQEDDSLLGEDYWQAISPVLVKEEVVPANDGWHRASTVRFVSRHDQEQFRELLQQLGVRTISQDIESHRSLLREVGVKPIALRDIAEKLCTLGFIGEPQISDLPPWFQQPSNRESLWEFIESLLGDDNDGDVLEECAIVQCNDGRLRAVSKIFTTDNSTSQLFKSICPDLHFAGDKTAAYPRLNQLIEEFGVQDAIEALKTRQEKVNEADKTTPTERAADVLTERAGEILMWVNDRLTGFKDDRSLIPMMKSLSVCPTSDGLQSFDNVVLPGGFNDPIGVTSVANPEVLQSVMPLLRVLELDTLSLVDYVTDRLPSAFEQYEFESDTCHELLTMLSQHQGELFDCELNAEVRATIRELHCIPCADGNLRCVDDGLYFAEDITKSVLGNSVPYVSDSVCTSGMKSLLTWLGVESGPRLDRVVDYLISTAASVNKPDQQVAERVITLLEHIGRRTEELREDEVLSNKLKANKWIPSATRSWDAKDKKWQSKASDWAAPGELYQYWVRHLVEAVGRFANLPSTVQSNNRQLLNLLGMIGQPSAKTVVKQLRASATSASPIDPRIYRFLNSALEDGELTPTDLRGLSALPCLYDAESEQFAKPAECFSEEHPFGQRRVLLGSNDLTVLDELLNALEIQPCPSWADAIAVLSEIAGSDDARLKRRISPDDKRSVTACWKMIESALKDEEISAKAIEEKLEKLANLPVVSRTDNLLTQPADVFFRDREHLAEAFEETLGAALIRIPLGASDALTRVGVRTLSEVTEVRITHDNHTHQDAQRVATRINERSELIVTVVETCRAVRKKSSLPNFEVLRVLEVGTLNVELTFRGFPRPLPPIKHDVVAAIEKSTETLFYRLEDGAPPWDAIACELARWCLGSDDVAQLSAAVSAAIEPDTLRQAQRKLNRLGFPSIEVTEEPPASQVNTPSFEIHGRQLPDQAHSGDEETQAPLQAKQEPAEQSGTPHSGEGAEPLTQEAAAPFAGSSVSNAGSNHGNNKTSSHPKPSTAASKPEPLNSDRFVDWLAAQAGAKERRKQKILSNSSKAERRRSEPRLTNQRVKRVPKAEVLAYLRSYYSMDGRLRCQMLKEGDSDLHEMPFWNSSERMYEGKEELFNREMANQLPFALPEVKELNLFLCPNCAAIYTKFIAATPRQQQRLFEWVRSDTSDTVFSLDCSLSGKQPNRTLHFHPKHLDDIRSVDGVYEAYSLSSESDSDAQDN